MSTSAACSLCGARDSWRHALLTCPMASSVGALADEAILDQMSRFGTDNVKGWLFAMKGALSSNLFCPHDDHFMGYMGGKKKGDL